MLGYYNIFNNKLFPILIVIYISCILGPRSLRWRGPQLSLLRPPDHRRRPASGQHQAPQVPRAVLLLRHPLPSLRLRVRPLRDLLRPTTSQLTTCVHWLQKSALLLRHRLVFLRGNRDCKHLFLNYLLEAKYLLLCDK